MWSLCLLALVACAETTPIERVVVEVPTTSRDPNGWCPVQATPPPKQITQSFEVPRSLANVSPMRKGGFDNYTIAYNRDGAASGMYIHLDPTIANGKLRLSTYPTSCRETNAGCFGGDWSRPAEVVLEDPTPVGACITYAFELDGRIVVGLGTEVRTYVEHEGGSVEVGPTLAAKPLEVIDVIDHRALLQERDGTLWTASWQGTRAPVLTQVAKLPGHVRIAERGNNGVVWAYTETALFALDEQTLLPTWHHDGEVWTALTQDVPLTHYLLTIERGGVKPKVVLRMLDGNGVESKQITVYEGEVTASYLEESDVWVRSDLVEGILVVHIAQ
jgi:hypothetical protein